jgi:hypothetical protein
MVWARMQTARPSCPDWTDELRERPANNSPRCTHS